MILEAKQMLESLESAGWDLSITHPDLKRPGNATSILATINDTATGIERIDILPPELTANHWCQANGNHNNFPVNKISGPFLEELENTKLTKFSRERDEVKRTAIIQEFLQETAPLPIPESPFTAGLQSKLRERVTVLSKLESSPASQYLRLMKLVASISKEQGSKLLFQILERLRSLSIDGDITCRKDAQKLLINLFFTKKKYPVPIIWNLAGKGLSERDSSSPENFNEINSALLSQGTEGSVAKIHCALTGEASIGVGDKFPQPTFPAIGKTYLFARNKQTPALGRYGARGTDTYQIGESYANQLASALNALTQPDREGRTWIKIPSDKPKKSDLLLVFQAGEEDRKLALAIGDTQTVYGESSFEELTKRVLERAQGKTKDQIRGRLLIAVLSAVDPGNRKVILNR